MSRFGGPETFAPVAPKTPWCHDPESGGPNPDIKKDGVEYDSTS